MWERFDAVVLGDYRFPHKVLNEGSTSRVHLIIDLVPNESLRAAVNDIAGFDWFGTSRAALSRECQQMLVDWRTRPPAASP